jgi:hypothetical protein
LIFGSPNVKFRSLTKVKLNLLRNPTMSGEAIKEEWMKLCEQAASERDPEKLMALTQEICRLLDEREQNLKGKKRS